MSYVLDALRKSEHERQRVSGQISSILYPVVVEQNRMIWLWAAMLGGAVLLVAIAVLTWWMWPHTPTQTHVVATPEKSAAVAAAPPAATQPPVTVMQVPKPESSKSVAAMVAPPARQLPQSLTKKAAISAKKVDQPAPPVAPAADKAKSDDDPLKDLPPLVISGYMHDEQAGSMAIINDKLVHEGEEVAPGLRLEKILGDGALFSYKGHQFKR